MQDDLLKHLVITLRETFIGYSCGTLLGIAMGVLLARFAFLGKVLDPFILALNGIPRIALAPSVHHLVRHWRAFEDRAGRACSRSFCASMPRFPACAASTRPTSSIARVMGATERQTFFKVVLPAASPWIITAMKVGVPFALVGAIVGEFMAATAGLGFKIQLYTAQFDTTGAVTGVLVLMVVVIMFNTALNRLEAHVLRWRPESSGRGGIGSSIETDRGEIAMAEQRRRPRPLAPHLRGSACASLAIGAPAIVRAQGLDQGQDHAARRKA